MRLIKKLFSRRWLGGTVLVLVAIALFVRLGIWQLDRLEQRRIQNAASLAVLAAPPLDLAAPLPATPEALENRLASVTGQYDFDNERILLLQPWQSQPGVILVTPLIIESSAEPPLAVLVNRGWIPQADFDAGALAQYQNETGTVGVDGYLALSQPSANGSSSATESEIYRVDIPAIAASLPYDLLPIVLVEAPEGDVDLDPPRRAGREIDLSEGPHLGYAVQWFIFSMLTGSLYLLFVRRSERERPSTSPNES